MDDDEPSDTFLSFIKYNSKDLIKKLKELWHKRKRKMTLRKSKEE